MYPAKPDPETLPTIAERLGDEDDDNPVPPVLVELRRAGPRRGLDRRLAEPRRRAIPSSDTGTASSRRRRSTIRGSTRAARSSSSTRWAGPRPASCTRGNDYIAPSIDISCAFHRARAGRTVAVRAGDVAERGRRADRLREPGVVARRHAARARHEPAALPPDAPIAVVSGPWRIASRRVSTSR